MPRRFALPAASLLLAGSALVGCGDDTASTTTTVAPAATRTVITIPVTTPPAFTPTASAVAGVGTPEYSAYVSRICAAAKQFKDDIAAAADTVRSDPQKAFEVALPPFERLGAALRDTDAPADLQVWQDDIENRVDTFAQSLRDRDAGALGDVFSDPFDAVPDGSRAALRDAARTSPDCKDAGLFQ